MKLVNHRDSAALLVEGGIVDVATASSGRFGPGVQDLLDHWQAFTSWAAQAGPFEVTGAFDAAALDAVVPQPGQVLAVGLNYRLHAEESGLPLPEVPLVFTKFPSSIAAPIGTVELPTAQVDWEVEVAVVIGTRARRVGKAEAWDHVAGITAAQDYSARDIQLAGGAKPQFSLGKSFEGFTPLGPVLVTPDEYDDRDAIALECRINGEVLQSSSTSDLIFDVATLVSYLSHIVTLRPGDVILTGTPSGVGLGFNPPRYLVDGDEVVTTVELAGELRQIARDPAEAFDAAALLA